MRISQRKYFFRNSGPERNTPPEARVEPGESEGGIGKLNKGLYRRLLLWLSRAAPARLSSPSHPSSKSVQPKKKDTASNVWVGRRVLRLSKLNVDRPPALAGGHFFVRAFTWLPELVPLDADPAHASSAVVSLIGEE